MRRLLTLLTILLTMGVSVYSQKTKKVSATYTYYAPETMSVEEAKRTALERAKIQAIADEFGTIVSQSTSTVITNQNGESDTRFFSLGGSDVKGEWIETIGEPSIEISYKNEMLVVLVNIKGRIMESVNHYIPISAKILRNGTEPRYEASEFKNGDDLYLFFQSPLDGFLLVYLIDRNENKAYCLLPYSSSECTSQKIEHDEKYIFFSESHVPPDMSAQVDEYTLTCGDSSDSEYHDIVLIFSPVNLTKSITNQDNRKLPRHLSLNEFEQWRAKLKAKSADLQIINKPISIQK